LTFHSVPFPREQTTVFILTQNSCQIILWGDALSLSLFLSLSLSLYFSLSLFLSLSTRAAARSAGRAPITPPEPTGGAFGVARCFAKKQSLVLRTVYILNEWRLTFFKLLTLEQEKSVFEQ
jgi:hypothetical protein